MQNIYLCIDLKTFYASVECVERNLNPFETNLVVADPSRGNGAICLAISPKMKMLGIKNRCRIFEIPKNIKYITAIPRMQKYIEYSANIYAIYLKYVSKDDIHIYSIDEAFLDITHYLKSSNLNALEFAKMILNDIFKSYGLTAICGIGTNLYLAKIALDIMSKHTPTNIGYLDEERYKKYLWHHRPLCDFWQIGHGIEKRLNRKFIFDMYDIAHTNPKILYKEFGVNAEFLIDHAFGRESCTIQDIKNYSPKTNSISNSQILFEDYPYEKARLILKEMVELLSEDLINKNFITDNLSLYIGYTKDILPAVNVSKRLSYQTNLFTKLSREFLILFDKSVNPKVKIRRIGISFNRLQTQIGNQLNLFDDEESQQKEVKIQKATIAIKHKYGKNAIIRGMNLEEGATTIIRNKLIGGHNGY